MDKLIAAFPDQLQNALRIASNFTYPYPNVNINNIIICGLGGSGIGGTLVANFLSNLSLLPILVHKDYELPKFVKNNTLFIACSYSGNTEETLNSYDLAFQNGANIIIISSGGKLLEKALKNNTPYIKIPSGMPPRSCLGYSLVQLLDIFYKGGIYDKQYEQSINEASKLLVEEQSNILTLAKEIAQKIFDKEPIIYSNANIEGVAERYRQQLNENSKMLAWHHIIPEMNHNELVGWTIEKPEKAIIFLRTQFENERTKIRIEFLKNLVAKYCPTIIEITSKGNDLIVQSLYLINIGDWVSYYIAEIKGIDAMEVNIINELKETLESQ